MRFYEEHKEVHVVYGVNKINGIFLKLFLIENDQKLSEENVSHTSTSDHQSDCSSIKKSLDLYVCTKLGKGIPLSLKEIIELLEQVIKIKKNLKKIVSYATKQLDKKYYKLEQKMVRKYSDYSTASIHNSVNGKKKIHKMRILRRTGSLSYKF